MDSQEVPAILHFIKKIGVCANPAAFPPPNPISHPRNRDGKDPENHLDFSPLVVNAIFIKNKIHSVPSTVAPCVEIASSEKSNSFPIPVSSPEAARKRDFSPSFGGRLKLPVPFSGGD